jgi:hypothetical protein
MSDGINCGVVPARERDCLWLLKNSFQGISTKKFARKLLNFGLQLTLKFTKITILVPFSTDTPLVVN